MTSDRMAAIALALGALALLLVAGMLLRRIASGQRSARTLADALDRRSAQTEAVASAAANAAAPTGAATQTARTSAATLRSGSRVRRALERAARAGTNWLETPLGRRIVANEDRRLLEQCGFIDARSRGLFLIARVVCACVLLLAVGFFADGHLVGLRYATALVIGLVAGFMVPKLVIARRAATRRAAVVDELPMLVDLLRLLQGVGLSLDQSMQVTIGDFRRMLPVLSSELEIAQRQFVAGRTREQSLQRLASSFDNEDLRAIVRLLVQVDRHGGAVQEPLRQFAERLRDGRRALLRERIGRLTVKMTGVMVITLLPALLIVTAGPGVLAALQMLSQTHPISGHR
jgi:tight adherence protein C